MSKVLLIRHLPATLSFQDKEQLLKHFGAEKVWETSSKRHYIFASFGSVESAKSSLIRLHQLELANRRLVVEYSFERDPITCIKTDIQQSATTSLVKDFLKVLNAWSPSLDFYQPPPPLKYKYPDINTEIAINIIHALFKHKPFYKQVLHLMNRMSLNIPFEDNLAAMKFFKESFYKFFISDVLQPPLPVSETESEMSSEENESKKPRAPVLMKRKHKLPVPSRKRPAMPTTTVPKAKKPVLNQEEVFETVTPVEPKRISVVVPQDALTKPTEEPEEVGEIGKFQKEEQSVTIKEVSIEPDQPTITKKELLKNRISYSVMKALPVFKNYHPGQPSMRLYIKNLAKSVTEQDVKRIYKRYVEDLKDEEQIGFDVRVMQEGRMKGQAFVTFPSIKIAESALHETNGYLLKDKPMVVQFARAANKKTIE
ncbi:hypothetical protein K1T71_005871 [Dendrolimus kikuchii]|uniref:Uncharacterized protein n=1 Tax=Dendrolimus kikuchii TaxID=765133 RepID=A0ACC1D375_9NEOP|nr:hypothetical protein K1T71_005871 [Dendrolimus kikuchii]